MAQEPEESYISYSETVMRAFPVEEDTISIEHAGATMRTAVRICRICGSLVLDSMTLTHVRELHYSRAESN